MTAEVVDAGDELPLTLPRLLASRAAARGDHPLLTCDDETLTYADAEGRSARLASGLLAAGAGKGTHVGLLLPNGADFVAGLLAATRIGAIALPLSTFSTADELRDLVSRADIEILLATSEHRSQHFEDILSRGIDGLDLTAAGPLRLPAAPNLRRLHFFGPIADRTDRAWSIDALLDAEIDEALLRAAEAQVTPADRFVVVHTSGSTSAPKGVIHTHGALLRHLDNLNQLRRYAPDDVLFSNSPFFWIGGLAYSLLGTLSAGAHLVCSNAADAAAVLDVVERTRPTMTNGFAASVAHLAADPTFPGRDLSSLRRGNLYPIMPADVRPADPELRHNMLGMTETGSVCLLADDWDELTEAQRGSFGRPAPGLETRIVDPDLGAEQPTGEVGELRFRGPFLMEGYLGRERHETFTTDGWYRTGDLFRADADGLFYFLGRGHDMIKTAGANVSPREVEQALADLTGRVAHVLGIDDATRGQIVVAALVDADVDEAGLREGLRQRLSAYKVPKRIIGLSRAEVPMLSSGKLDARALSRLIAARIDEDGAARAG